MDEVVFKLIPAEGADHEIEITFEVDDEGDVTFALRGEKRYERLVGKMEMKVREAGVHLSLPEVTREGPNLHAFICAWQPNHFETGEALEFSRKHHCLRQRGGEAGLARLQCLSRHRHERIPQRWHSLRHRGRHVPGGR